MLKRGKWFFGEMRERFQRSIVEEAAPPEYPLLVMCDRVK
jgi:hypothetical protein